MLSSLHGTTPEPNDLILPHVDGFGQQSNLPLEEFVARRVTLPNLDEKQRQAAVAQHATLLCSRWQGADVRVVPSHRFPDGSTFDKNYFVVEIGGRRIGVLDFDYGTLDGFRVANRRMTTITGPCCVLRLVQGHRGCNFSSSEEQGLGFKPPVDPRSGAPYRSVRHFLLDTFLLSCLPLIQTGWHVALQVSSPNRKLREPYFPTDESVVGIDRSPIVTCESFFLYTATIPLALLKKITHCRSLKGLFKKNDTAES